MKIEDKNILIYDIETLPMLVWTHYIGNKVSITHKQIHTPSHICCIGYKWYGERETHIIKTDKPGDASTKKMMEKFLKLANKATAVYGQNSNSFDNRWIRAQALRDKTDCKWINTLELDFLSQAKRSFRLPSYRLDYIADMLGHGNKNSMGFQDWIDVAQGDEKAFDKMIKYCKKDVQLTEKVITDCLPYLKLTAKEIQAFGLKKDISDKSFDSCPDCDSLDYIKHGLRSFKDYGTVQVFLCRGCSQVFPNKKHLG